MSQRPDLPRVPTGIPEFDRLANGGLPRGRTTLVSGPEGSGKTVMALQFLCAGARDYGERGVLVSFAEAQTDLIQNVSSFGWNFDRLVEQDNVAIVDASLHPDEENVHTGPHDLTALIARTEYAVKRVAAKRVVLDAVDRLVASFPHASDVVRRELDRLLLRLRERNVTAMATGRGKGSTRSVCGTDNVILLRNRREEDRRRRTIEVLKLRGAAHRSGRFPFSIDPEKGVVVLDDEF